MILFSTFLYNLERVFNLWLCLLTTSTTNETIISFVVRFALTLTTNEIIVSFVGIISFVAVTAPGTRWWVGRGVLCVCVCFFFYYIFVPYTGLTILCGTERNGTEQLQGHTMGNKYQNIVFVLVHCFGKHFGLLLVTNFLLNIKLVWVVFK